MTINELVKKSYETSRSKGFHEDGKEDIPLKLMLIVSEVSEALEELRSGHKPGDIYYRKDGKPEGFLMEIADSCIRLFDLCGSLGLDLQKAIEEKMAFNETRPYKHGKEF